MAGELHRGRVVVELVEGEGEELSGRDNDLGEKATPVGVEKPVQRPADGVVGQPFGLLPREPEALGREGVHHLCQPVDGLPLREDGSQEDPPASLRRASGSGDPR